MRNRLSGNKGAVLVYFLLNRPCDEVDIHFSQKTQLASLAVTEVRWCSTVEASQSIGRLGMVVHVQFNPNNSHAKQKNSLQ